MTIKEKLAYIENNHLGEWIKKRRIVEDELSRKQNLFCICGKLATGLHESCCQKFKQKVNNETVKQLSYLIPKKI